MGGKRADDVLTVVLDATGQEAFQMDPGTPAVGEAWKPRPSFCRGSARG